MLRIRLMPFNGISPLIMIPAVKDDLQMVMLCNDEQILITLHEFSIWEYVAVREEEHRFIPLGKESLHRAR